MNPKTEARLPIVTVGEILKEDFLRPLALTEYRLAKDIGVSPRRINEIVHGRRAVTVDTAYRLSRYFGTSVELWLNLQLQQDLEAMRREDKLPEIPRCPLIPAA